MDDRDRSAVRAAMRLHATDDCEVDTDARVSWLDEPGTGVEGAAWVQVWKLIPADEIAKEAGA